MTDSLFSIVELPLPVHWADLDRASLDCLQSDLGVSTIWELANSRYFRFTNMLVKLAGDTKHFSRDLLRANVQTLQRDQLLRLPISNLLGIGVQTGENIRNTLRVRTFHEMGTFRPFLLASQITDAAVPKQLPRPGAPEELRSYARTDDPLLRSCTNILC